jgi:hypothetical protein
MRLMRNDAAEAGRPSSDRKTPPGKLPDALPEAAPAVIVRLLLARALRDFGDGFVAILLPVYLAALELSPWRDKTSTTVKDAC